MSQDNKEVKNTNEMPEAVANVEEAIEAILFAAGYPVRYDKIAEVLGLDAKDVRALTEHMASRYNPENSGRGIQLLTFPDTCQLATKEIYLPYIREALGIRRGGNLSASSMEVLAIVAYNQPTTRAYIDAVRGVDSSYAVGSLLDKGLIEACGRLDAPGRPMLYATSDKFLRVFGLNSLSELPATEALSAAAQNAAADKTENDPDGESTDTSSDPSSEGAEAEIPNIDASEILPTDNTPGVTL